MTSTFLDFICALSALYLRFICALSALAGSFQNQPYLQAGGLNRD